jgi:RNA polymerase sigma-70 factor (ECF subfamily)
MTADPSPIEELARQARQGEGTLFSELLAQYRARLRRLVQVRLDRRLQGRIDPSDVIQEAYLEATSRLNEFLRQPNLPFFVWLRLITIQKLALMHRKHIGTLARDATRDVSIDQGMAPGATSVILAAQLLGRLSSPTDHALREERRRRLEDGLTRLDEIDREVLILRHFEELTNIETAAVLGIKPSAASNRYVRALQRLEEVLKLTLGAREGDR